MLIDLTGIAISFMAGFFGVLAVAVPSLVDRHMRRAQARDVLRHAIRSSIGALQQSGTMSGQLLAGGGDIPGVPTKLQPAVRYVMENAGAEMDLLDLTPERIAHKVLAQIGLTQIATNQAIASSAAPIVPDPLGPVPMVSAPRNTL